MQFQTPKHMHPQIKKNKLTNKYSKDLERNKQSTNIDIKSCISLVNLQFLVFYYPKSLLVNFPLLITILSKYHILIVNMCVCVCLLLHIPAQPEAPFEFQQAPFPECLLALLMPEWPLNSFEPELQSLRFKQMVRNCDK